MVGAPDAAVDVAPRPSPREDQIAVTALSFHMRSGIDGTIDVSMTDLGGRPVVLARSSSERRRGALGRQDGEGLAAAARLALRQRTAFVMVLSSSGADVSEGVDALHGWGRAAAAIAACSGVVPLLAGLTGPALSGPALMLGLCDAVVMTAEAFAYVSGPSMVEQFTGVSVTPATLGGVGVHARSSGLCALESDNPLETLADVFSYLPPHTDAAAPATETDDPWDRSAPELRAIVPARATASYDVREVVRVVADHQDLLELWARWAPQLVTGFSRIDGHAVGVVANQPRSLAGTLDIAASQKGARFVRLCDAFNLPIVTFVDTPGFLPGKDLEWRGMIRHGAGLVFAYAEATVPRLAVILRKAMGGAYIAMDSKGLGSTLCLAWPGAQPAVMGAREAVGILRRAAGPDERAELEVAYRDRFLAPWEAAERGYVDMVIDPADTRRELARALRQVSDRRERLVGRKHDAGPV
jgi:acetyl-CoA carboxylase carboxyltransferase component